MNNRLLRRVAVLLVAPFAPAVACGGRTGDLGVYSADSGAVTGSGGASNGKNGTGAGISNPPVATGAKPPTGRPPVMGSGGTIGKPPPPPVSGGKAAVGGSAGFAAAGGTTSPGCGPPFCNCGDCISSCACMLGGQVTQFCIDQCAGPTGAGGATQVVCAGPPGQGARICPSSSNFPFPSCCTASRECGLELLLSPGSPMSYPFATGCQALNQPGRPEPGCPDLNTLFNANAGGATGGPGAGGPPACCRNDGTCGIDASQISLGCVQSLIGGRPIECPGSDAGTGGHPPVDAAAD